MCIHSYLHAGLDFSDTVIETKVPTRQSQLVQAIEIFDDEINEGREVFGVSMEVVSNISNNVTYRIQTTLCRIRRSDRKLYLAKFALHLMWIQILELNYYQSVVLFISPFLLKATLKLP